MDTNLSKEEESIFQKLLEASNKAIDKGQRPATKRQCYFLASLVVETKAAIPIKEGDGLNIKEASRIIDQILKAKKKAS